MQELEVKYKSQVSKNSSILRMNSNLMGKNDILNRFAYQVMLVFSEEVVSPEHEFEEGELQKLLDTIKKGKEGAYRCENCDALEEELQRTRPNVNPQINEERWKFLYLKETEETFRLSKVNSTLMDSLRQFQLSAREFEQELKVFLDDYFQIFKKVNAPSLSTSSQALPSIEQTTHKKRQRSNSTKKTRKGSKQKLQKHQKTLLLQQGHPKQVATLIRLRELSVRDAEALRKQHSQTLALLRGSEEKIRLLRRSLIEQILDH